MSKMAKTSPESSGEIGKKSKNVKKGQKWPFFSGGVLLRSDRSQPGAIQAWTIENRHFFGHFWGGPKWVIFDTFLKFHPKIRPSATLKNRPRKEPGEGQKLEFGGRKKGVQKKWQKNVFFKNRFLRLPETVRKFDQK